PRPSPTRLRRVRSKLSQSDFVESESTLSRDCVGSVFVETRSDQSFPRASEHSTLSIYALLCFPHYAIIENIVSLRKFDPRSSSDPLHDLDPKIEITLRRLRKARNIIVNNRNSSNSVFSSNNSSPNTNNSDSFKYSSTNNFAEPE
ncbi:hypothetical protein CR513_06964, partial [Mucuna pruriens]